MNNRQKAKHWKQLYELALPKKPYPVVYKTLLPKHYKVQYLIDAREVAYIQQDPHLLKHHIENGVLRELRPLIWDNLKAEKDIYTDKYRYTLDVWVEPQESEVEDGNDDN